MRKIDRFLFCILMYVLTFTGVYAGVQTDIISFSTSESIIEGKTSRVGFTTTLRVIADSRAKGQYIELKDWRYTEVPFIRVEEIKNTANGRYKVEFKDNGNGDIDDTVEFTATGTLLFDWSNTMEKFPMRVRIGKVTEHYNGSNLGYVEIDLREVLEIVSTLQVNVKNHMDFGTIIAGHRADTSEGSREPAKVEVEGVVGRDVKVMIPNTTEIENESGNTLTVNLRFEEKKNLERVNDKQMIVKNISNRNAGNSVGTTDEITIHGSVQTREKNYGNYKGQFKVRVEYDY